MHNVNNPFFFSSWLPSSVLTECQRSVGCHYWRTVTWYKVDACNWTDKVRPNRKLCLSVLLLTVQNRVHPHCHNTKQKKVQPKFNSFWATVDDVRMNRKRSETDKKYFRKTKNKKLIWHSIILFILWKHRTKLGWNNVKKNLLS